jgi:protein-tyrosine phosphatase
MIKVLFVCAGNICRSPMAEAVFQDMVNKADLSHQIQVDSAGTGSWHIGEKAHPNTMSVLKKRGITYKGRARQFVRADLIEFDYVLPMDAANRAYIERHINDNKAKVNFFLHYANESGMVDVDEVPDPYGSSEVTYLEVYDLITQGCTALLAHIRARHNLWLTFTIG